MLRDNETDLVIRIGNALSSSLELHLALDRAIPLLQRVIGAEHVALAVSRPGTLYDYEWYNSSLPESFLGHYPEIAEHDFVRKTVVSAPNQVFRDHQMITRPRLERHVLYQHARDTGADLEHVMAVMLCHEDQWSSGLSLYRSRRVPFSDRDAALLQMVVPQIVNAVRNCREHAQLKRDIWLEPVVEQAGLAAIWVDLQAREIARTAAASTLLERFFPPHERRGDTLPTPLRDHFRCFVASRTPNKTPREWRRQQGLSRLTARFVPLPQHERWALVLRAHGLAPSLEAKLSPRLVVVAQAVLDGMTNEQIAARANRKLATVKQQVSDIYARLGVKDRADFVRLATGLTPSIKQRSPRT